MTRKVLLTGAAGKVGSFFVNAYVDAYEFVLTDIVEPAETKGGPLHTGRPERLRCSPPAM